MQAKVIKSPRSNKRYRVIMGSGDDQHSHDFGSPTAQTYVDGASEQKRQNYLKRHRANEDWSNIHSAGFWARYLLWEKRTLREAARYIQRNFDIEIQKSKVINGPI